jgi:hydrogenase/urease accessory protein HupE
MAQAHPFNMDPVVVQIHAQKTFLTATFTGSIQTLYDNGLGAGDRKGDGWTDAAEKRTQDYINQSFQIKIGGTPLTGTLTDMGAEQGPDLLKAHFDVSMRYPRTGNALKKLPLTINASLYNPSTYKQTIIIMGGFSKTLDTAQTITIDPSELAVNLFRNIKDFMTMGMMHIFTGPDHMLFILGLLMASSTLRSLIKTLTGFTIAHSITLALSALNIVVLPGHICDIMIALSIIYVGAENMLKKETKHRFWITSAFGFVHGFGFSDQLRSVGMPQDSIGWCLMSFNMGVEVAQVIICCLAFPVLIWFKNDIAKRAVHGGMSWPAVLRMGSAWVVVMGAYWLLQRTMG